MTVTQLIDYLRQFDGTLEVVLNGNDAKAANFVALDWAMAQFEDDDPATTPINWCGVRGDEPDDEKEV